VARPYPQLRCTFGGRSLVPDLAIFTEIRIPHDDNGEVEDAFTITPDWTNTLKAIGDVLQFLKRSDDALSRYDEALTLYEKVGDQLGKANTLRSMGIQLSQQGNYRQAVPLVESALATYRQIGDRYSQANALQVLAVLYQNTGRIKAGFACGQDANQIFMDLGLLSYTRPRRVQSIQSIVLFAMSESAQIFV
jgi:tetratricopeptide (TPR) repeat protein